MANHNHWNSAPTVMRQRLAIQCKRAQWTTGAAKLVQPSSAIQESQNGRVLPRGGGEKSNFRRTNVLQPLQPKQPILLCPWVQPTRGMCVPSVGGPPQEQFHRHSQPEPWQSRHNEEQKPRSCPLHRTVNYRGRAEPPSPCP